MNRPVGPAELERPPKNCRRSDLRNDAEWLTLVCARR